MNTNPFTQQSNQPPVQQNDELIQKSNELSSQPTPQKSAFEQQNSAFLKQTLAFSQSSPDNNTPLAQSRVTQPSSDNVFARGLPNWNIDPPMTAVVRKIKRSF